ncbi:TIGR02679 family protein [Castellaniella sp.]|uniref:TIGR02679 family protein n=1 Tax=Castellaniella sp. TaxID=1955812 RepID=UPI002AFF939A|nr:TIGR02679 family protein [Castellaniella sp.]
MPPDDARLQRLLGGPDLEKLRQRLRRHYERHPAGQHPSYLQLGGLSPQEQERLAELMGKPTRPAKTVRIDLTRIDMALHQAGVCASLRAALEYIDGPLIDRQAAKTEQMQAWTALTSGQRHADGCGDRLDTRLLVWLQTPLSTRLLKRLGRSDIHHAASLLSQAHAVMQQLPAQGMPRAQLAARTLGDAHALDDGRAVARLVLAVWAQTEAAPLSEPEVSDEHSRTIWARAGILVNELARPALCLNLPVQDIANATWQPGIPAYLSLRQLLRHPPRWAVAGITVHVCENPNLLAIAADQLADHCTPLVCTDGMPSAAQRTLLDQLSAAGAKLAYHGDFDWPGLQIANYVQQRWQARPWRMSAADYANALQHAPHRPPDLGDAAAQARWDPALTLAMQTHGLIVAEEAVADSLMPDLRRTHPSKRTG